MPSQRFWVKELHYKLIYSFRHKILCRYIVARAIASACGHVIICFRQFSLATRITRVPARLACHPSISTARQRRPRRRRGGGGEGKQAAPHNAPQGEIRAFERHRALSGSRGYRCETFTMRVLYV